MTETELIKIAKVIYAEGGIFSGKNAAALLAIAQCIHDLLPDFKNNLDTCLKSAFTTPTDQYDSECLKAATDVFELGKRRFPDAKILQFRSFTKYSDGHGNPDKEKLASLYANYEYLGSDSISEKWGHFYFGRKEKSKMSFRLLVIAGHGKNTDGFWDPGACGCGYQEANLTRELRDLIKVAADQAGVPCDVAPDRNHYSYFKHGGTFDFTPYNYVLEVHFNASATTDTVGDGNIKGSMMYISQSETGHSVEDAILANLYALGSRQAWDGVVIAQRQWVNGLLVQETCRKQAVSHAVLETCFISDKDDVQWYQNKKAQIAKAIVKGIIEGFKLDKGSERNFETYMVKVTDPALNIRKEPTTDSAIVGCIKDKGSYTIVAEAFGKGASKWGKLKSGAGWISLDYTKR